jgi:hypothetical protein
VWLPCHLSRVLRCCGVSQAPFTDVWAITFSGHYSQTTGHRCTPACSGSAGFRVSHQVMSRQGRRAHEGSVQAAARRAATEHPVTHNWNLHWNLHSWLANGRVQCQVYPLGIGAVVDSRLDNLSCTAGEHLNLSHLRRADWKHHSPALHARARSTPAMRQRWCCLGAGPLKQHRTGRLQSASLRCLLAE